MANGMIRSNNIISVNLTGTTGPTGIIDTPYKNNEYIVLDAYDNTAISSMHGVGYIILHSNYHNYYKFVLVNVADQSLVIVPNTAYDIIVILKKK